MSDTPSDSDDPAVPLSAEMMDREERKALKEKARQERAAKKEKLVDEKVEAALANSKLTKAQKAQRKKIIRIGMAGLGLCFCVWVWNYLFATYQADLRYGVCKTFLELNVQFPQDLRLSSVEDFPDNGYIRLWYTQIDAFGEYRMENIQCHFRADDVMGMALEKISVDRREVDPQRVDLFNTILPVVLASPLDLDLPYALPDSLEDLQIQTDAFRFQIGVRGK